jgi:hypothetical protein
MRCHDLPENINDLPLDDPGYAAGVIDLCLGLGDRIADTLLALPCDEHGRSLRVPVLVAGVPWGGGPAERRRGARFLSEIPAPGVVVAVSSGPRLPESVVRRWLRAVERELGRGGPTLLAFAVADAESVDVIGGRAASEAA